MASERRDGYRVWDQLFRRRAEILKTALLRLTRLHVDLWLLLKTVPSLDPAGRRAREWRATHALYGALRQALDLFPEMEARIAEAHG